MKSPGKIVVFPVIILTLLVGALWFVQKDFSRLPVYGDLPDFSLIDSEGKSVELSTLKGKVWVSDFIFTRCEDTCPLESAEMASLQKDFESELNFRLVSITADPDFDSPLVLKKYAERFNADPQKWFFLTGEKKRIQNLVMKGFRLAIAISGASHLPIFNSKNSVAPIIGNILVPTASAHANHDHGENKKLGVEITHSSRFVLVDQSAQIRGYYHSNDPDSLKKLRIDIRSLL